MRGSNYIYSYDWEIFGVWIKVVAYERWSHMEVRLFMIDHVYFTLIHNNP